MYCHSGETPSSSRECQGKLSASRRQEQGQGRALHTTHEQSSQAGLTLLSVSEIESFQNAMQLAVTRRVIDKRRGNSHVSSGPVSSAVPVDIQRALHVRQLRFILMTTQT